ncbi:MAG: hypothetical protein RIT02_1455, partial [Planctomycetota bacterium]
CWGWGELGLPGLKPRLRVLLLGFGWCGAGGGVLMLGSGFSLGGR